MVTDTGNKYLMKEGDLNEFKDAVIEQWHDVEEKLKKLAGEHGDYFMALEICPKTKAVHFQCAWTGKTPRTHAQVAKIIGAHKRAKGDWRANVRYIAKDDTKPSRELLATMGWTYKDCFASSMSADEINSYIAQRDDATLPIEERFLLERDPEDQRYIEVLRPWQQDMMTILFKLHKEKNNRLCPVVFDSEGNSGKTSFFMAMLQRRNDVLVFQAGCKKSDVIDIIRRRVAPMPDARGKEIAAKPLNFIFIDISRKEGASGDFLSYSLVEEILNGMITSGKYEGATYRFKNFVQVCIATNYMPNLELLSKDRWMLFNIKGQHLCVERPGLEKQFQSMSAPYPILTEKQIEKEGWKDTKMDVDNMWADLQRFGWSARPPAIKRKHAQEEWEQVME